MEQRETNVPKMLTIRETARTGILPEYALRQLVRQGKIPHIQCGNRVLINYSKLCTMLNDL